MILSAMSREAPFCNEQWLKQRLITAQTVESDCRVLRPKEALYISSAKARELLRSGARKNARAGGWRVMLFCGYEKTLQT